MELPPAALLRLAVHGHRALAQQRLRLAARPDDPGNLERLPEPDGVAPDLDLPHVRDGSARPGAGAGRRQAASSTSTPVCFRAARAKRTSAVRSGTPSSPRCSARARYTASYGVKFERSCQIRGARIACG